MAIENDNSHPEVDASRVGEHELEILPEQKASLFVAGITIAAVIAIILFVGSHH